MSSDFIGVQMLVTLIDPPGTKLKGTVSAVEAGTGLTLSNVWRLDTNKWEPRVKLHSRDIQDLTEIPVTPAAAVAPPVAPPLKPAFIDPAIVAVGKRPGSISARVPELHPLPNTSEKRDPGPLAVVGAQAERLPGSDLTPGVQASESLKGLRILGKSVAADSADEDQAVGAAASGSQRRKGRRHRRAGNPRNGAEASPQPTESAGKGKGWRNTPMLQSPPSFQPFNSLKTKNVPLNDNGWASEDVTDVQEMGDFDFEGGLAKFDKQNLFEQMRKEDLVPEDDRLVSHNRQARPKPGTAGGKNLHYTENVLDTPPTILKAKEKAVKEPPNDFWNSEADDPALNGSDRLSGRELGMGSRQGSRRGESKVSAGRRSQSRKASRATAGPAINRVNSGVSHYRTQSVRGSRPNSRLSTNAVGIDKAKQLSTQMPRGLYVNSPSKRRIEPVSALQMLNLENIAHNEIGLTEAMMTENAGRGIAEVALTALSDPAIQVRHARTPEAASGGPPPQTVVVLAGNNKSGIRAVAAARHMRNKGLNVIVCVVGLERDLLEDMRTQVGLYKNLGGRVYSKTDFFEYIRKSSIPMLTIDTPRSALSSLANPAPVMLIVDALLGLAIPFEELRNGDQATVYELIEWANRNEAFVLSVDIPTGVDPSSGKVSVIDGNRLYVKPRYVVAIGAPKRGLLEAMVAAENEDGDTVLAGGDTAVPDDGVTDWNLFLVDMGLGPAVWKKAGTKMRKGIDFEQKWVLGMRYQGLALEEDE
ncbi:YjeF-related protein N-terminus-domain-containing protein [Podospora aff. communis PSN243]|uniref:Enhancer of mRNA-decapping protein 3 n=1 Tax=Podospora aff. communis PSN243 TaxID=3040156 RepID=A0AAV9H7M4_9PEZI|nr:YjeF-related protein N-terminus-domain-containing protein [Podospora aff. communis PSN243]